MNFRYHAILIAILSMAIHFHSNTGSVGTITLAQIGPEQTTEIATAPVVKPEDAKPATIKKEYNSRTQQGRNAFKLILEQDTEIDELHQILNRGPRTTARIVDGAGLPVDCKCNTVIAAAIVDIEKDPSKLNPIIESGEKAVDAKVKKDKEAEEKAQRDKDNCVIEDLEENISCIETKLADSDTKPEDKTKFRQQLSDRLQAALREKGKEETTLTLLRNNKNILKLLDPSQVSAITTSASNYLAGKAAFEISKELRTRVQPLFIAALNTNNLMESQQLLARANIALQNVQVRTASDQHRKFQSELNSTFGRSQIINTNDAWTLANTKNVTAIQTLRNPQTDVETIARLDFMEDLYDGRHFIASGQSVLNPSGSLMIGNNEDILESIISGNTRGRRGNGFQARGLNGQRGRPTLANSNFEVYMNEVRNNSASALGNRGLSSPGIFNSFQNPVPSYSQNQVPSNSPQVSSTNGRGRTRPTLGGLFTL